MRWWRWKVVGKGRLLTVCMWKLVGKVRLRPVVCRQDLICYEMKQVEVRSKGPLGYVVKISTTAGSKYDGLVYHNDIFETPPAVGDKTDAWVLKVLLF
jgi:hypothetical protein